MRPALVLGIAGLCLLYCDAPLRAQQSTAQSANAAADLEEVLITGSRVKRPDGFDYPVPVAVVSGDALTNSGYTQLGDALNNLPQALASTGNQNTSASLFNSGQQRINLRGVGNSRTLVLVDGRRHLTGDFQTNAVDLNSIPSTMIERIEAISGGASAVYGSEAIAGVVNIILKKDLQGFVFDLQGGQTQENDGEEWKGSVAYGTRFADDRGSFLIGAEYGRINPIWQVDRDWAFPGTRRNSTVSPQTVLPASRSNTMPTATFQFVLPMGVPARSVSVALDHSAINLESPACATATVAPTCQDPWLFYTATYNALQGETKRATARTYADFKLTDNIKAFADFTFARVDGIGLFQPSFSSAAGGGTLPVDFHGDNGFMAGNTALAEQMRQQWAAAGLAFTQGAIARVGKFWEEFGRRDSEILRQSYRLVSGIEGGFELLGRSVTYDAYGQYSELDGFAKAFNVPYIARVQQATDAVLLNGQVVCRDAAARAAGCVPWDLINGPSAEAVAWANADARSNGVARQQIVATNFSTDLFQLPAGGLGFAVGAEYRKEQSDQIQDDVSASGQLFYNAIGRTKGEYDITEGYAELVIPLLRDKLFAHRLSIEGAERVGHYSTVGTVNQWRVGLQWAPIQDLSFRGSKSVAVRAPNIAELFGPEGQNFTTAATDPCDNAQVAAIAGDAARRATRVANCAAAIPNYDPATFVSNFGPGRPSLALLEGGNPNLSEESAKTWTVGLVFQPRFFTGLNASIDYWDIDVDDAVSTIPINTLITNLCYDSPEAPSSNRFCDLIHRDGSGAVTLVERTNQNVQSIQTSGIDLALSIAHDFGRVGAFQFRADGTKIVKWDLQGVPGGATTHYVGTLTAPFTATPKYKVGGTLAWSLRKVTAQWESHYLSSMAVSEVDPVSSRAPFFTGNYWEHDLHARYRFSDQLQLRLGVVNVTNEHPPLIPEVGNATGTNTSAYDNRGRWYFVGGSYAF
ncbi:MAG TPA: TonB-dependent receptor [Steroidobacteraceae bacterium]|jgi:iron complex outermembrane receptor protein|nr:TonB-dependent receptor [Steroidobacteraceae bacterium]